MTRFTWAVCPVSQCWPTRLPSGRSPSAKDSRVASRTSESMESVPRSQPSSKTTILQVRPVFYSLIVYAHAITASKYWIDIYSSLIKFPNIRISVGISLGCLMQNSLNPCDPNPCKNYGRCEPTLAAFKCHCEMTGYEGETCNIGSFSCYLGRNYGSISSEPSPVELDGEQQHVYVLPTTVVSEAEHVQFRFKVGNVAIFYRFSNF